MMIHQKYVAIYRASKGLQFVCFPLVGKRTKNNDEEILIVYGSRTPFNRKRFPLRKSHLLYFTKKIHFPVVLCFDLYCWHIFGMYK